MTTPLTAHDLAADSALLHRARGFTIPGSRMIWEDAQYLERGHGRKVRIARLAVDIRKEGWPTQVNRWVAPDTAVELVAK